MRVLTKAVLKDRSQREAVMDLLRWHFQDPELVLDHTESGKPYLTAHPQTEISISHCRTDAAVAIGNSGTRIGVDVEEKWAETARLSHRFCTSEELTISSETGLHPMWFWCVKEACFKAYSDRMRTPYRTVTVTGLDAAGNLSAEIAGIGSVTLRKLTLPSGAALVCLL